MTSRQIVSTLTQSNMAKDIGDTQQVACIPMWVSDLPASDELGQGITPPHEKDQKAEKSSRETAKTHPVSC